MEEFLEGVGVLTSAAVAMAIVFGIIQLIRVVCESRDDIERLRRRDAELYDEISKLKDRVFSLEFKATKEQPPR